MTDAPRGSWAPGDSFDGYVIEKVLGAGGMGFVYKARQTGLDRDVAIKTLLPEHASRPEYIARFKREGRASTRIKSRHVVQVFDVREHQDVPYLVMEFLDGVSLEQHLETHGACSVAESVTILLPVCEAVEAAHRVGVIHRDLKPANVFLARDASGSIEPKVVDFGISRIQEEVSDGLRTQTRAMLGTPAYLSPEQTRGAKHVSERSDQYALGVMLYECMTGAHPFPEEDFFALLLKISQGKFAPPRAVRPTLSPALEAVILRAMATDPAARFDSVAALAAALSPFAHGDAPTTAAAPVAAPMLAAPTAVTAAPSTVVVPARKPVAWGIFAAAALLALSLLAGLAWALTHRDSTPVTPPPAATDAAVPLRSDAPGANALTDATAVPAPIPPPTHAPTHAHPPPPPPAPLPPEVFAAPHGPGRRPHPHRPGRHGHHGASIR